MRPFRFFFALSLGIALFLFFAKFIIFALFGAAILSLVFFLARKIKYFFRRLDWEGNDYYADQYRGNFRSRKQMPVWKNDLLVHYPSREREFAANSRTIEIL